MKTKIIYLTYHYLFEIVFVLLVVTLLVFVGSGLKQDNDSKAFFAKFAAKKQQAATPTQKTSVATTQTPTTTPATPTTTKTITPVVTTPAKPVTTPPVVVPTAADISKAESDASAVLSMLSGYGAEYSYYPSELDPQTLVDVGNSGGSGFNVGMFSLPAGLSLQYLPTPSGCTTAGQNCTNFTLNVIQESNGSTVYSLSGLPF